MYIFLLQNKWLKSYKKEKDKIPESETAISNKKDAPIQKRTTKTESNLWVNGRSWGITRLGFTIDRAIRYTQFNVSQKMHLFQHSNGYSYITFNVDYMYYYSYIS